MRVTTSAPSLSRFTGIAVLLGIAFFLVEIPAAAADEPEGEVQAANAESDAEMSDRQRRREERRRQREESEADAAPETAAEDSPSEFVVAVEPEMECRRVAVLGSRVPKEVCTPVGQAAYDEQQAEEFLRRTQELQTVIPQDQPPFINTGSPF